MPFQVIFLSLSISWCVHISLRTLLVRSRVETSADRTLFTLRGACVKVCVPECMLYMVRGCEPRNARDQSARKFSRVKRTRVGHKTYGGCVGGCTFWCHVNFTLISCIKSVSSSSTMRTDIVLEGRQRQFMLADVFTSPAALLTCTWMLVFSSAFVRVCSVFMLIFVSRIKLHHCVHTHQRS